MEVKTKEESAELEIVDQSIQVAVKGQVSPQRLPLALLSPSASATACVMMPLHKICIWELKYTDHSHGCESV